MAPIILRSTRRTIYRFFSLLYRPCTHTVSCWHTNLIFFTHHRKTSNFHAGKEATISHASHTGREYIITRSPSNRPHLYRCHQASQSKTCLRRQPHCVDPRHMPPFQGNESAQIFDCPLTPRPFLDAADWDDRTERPPLFHVSTTTSWPIIKLDNVLYPSHGPDEIIWTKPWIETCIPQNSARHKLPCPVSCTLHDMVYGVLPLLQLFLPIPSAGALGGPAYIWRTYGNIYSRPSHAHVRE